MKFSTSMMALSAASAAAAAPAASTTPQTFTLKTSIVDGLVDFDGLFLGPLHSGAGINDAILFSDAADAGQAYTVATNETQADGTPYYNLQFCLTGIDDPYELVLSEGVDTYAGWQPSTIEIGGINAGGSTPYSGFYFNSTGLQWTDSPNSPNANSFGGWLVCDWWRGDAQLFFIVNGFDTPYPTSCAKVNLIPVYQASG